MISNGYMLFNVEHKHHVQDPSTAAAKCTFSDCDLSQIKDTCKEVNRVFEQGQLIQKDELCLSQAMIC